MALASALVCMSGSLTISSSGVPAQVEINQAKIITFFLWYLLPASSSM
jgi:hypothetical protein